MTKRLRNKDVAKPGNGGEFAKHTHSDPESSLQPLTEGSGEPEWQWQPVYSFPYGRRGAAVQIVAAANRRLERAGIDERFTYEMEDFFRDDPENYGVKHKWTRMTLNAPRLRFDGWELIAVTRYFGPDKTPVTTPIGRDTLPVIEGLEKPRCDQCGRASARSRVFTVRHTDGSMKHLGTSCARLFLGVSPQGLLSLGAELDKFEDDTFLKPGATERDEYIDSRDLLLAAMAASDDGRAYVPASQTLPGSGKSTYAQFMVNRHKLIEAGDTPERQQLADDILEWVEAQEPEDYGYMHSLKQVLSTEHQLVPKRYYALVMSAVSSYRRHLERQLEVKEEKAAPAKGYVGEVGERFEPVAATVMKAVPVETEWGTSQLLLFRTADNKVIKWFTSSYQPVDAGDEVTIGGRVKAHEQYRDTDQTAVTRAKVTLVRAAERDVADEDEAPRT